MVNFPLALFSRICEASSELPPRMWKNTLKFLGKKSFEGVYGRGHILEYYPCSRCTLTGIAAPPGADKGARAADPPNSQHASGSRALPRRRTVAQTWVLPEPTFCIREYSSRVPSFASNQDRSIVFPSLNSRTTLAPAPEPIAGRRCPGSEEAVVRDGPRPEMFSSLASAALVAVAAVTKTTATAAPRHSFRG